MTTYIGTAGNDYFTGTTTSDYLFGGAGNDSLFGDAGDDILDGGTGYDLLNGGAGNDFYVIRSRATSITETVPDYNGGTYSGASDTALVFTVGVAPPVVQIPRGFGTYISVEFIENWTYAPGVPDELPYWISALTGGTSSSLPAIQRAAAGNNTRYFYFPDTMPASTYSQDADGWSPLTAAERNFVRQALASISTVVDLNFVEATDRSHAGTLTFATNLQPLGEIKQYGYAYMPDSSGNSSIFYNTALRSQTFSHGSDVLHEIGHALGLGHPFGMSTTEDTLAWTVMSYRGGARSAFGYSPLDIAALQSIYGPSRTARTESNTYKLSAGGANIIWDGGGIDAIDGSALGASIDMSLMEGYWGHIGAANPALISSAGSITINLGTVIEKALGGSGNDTITGNYEDNLLAGNAGNDILDGLGGNDTIQGGDGIDIAVFHGLRADFDIASTGVGAYTITDKRDSRTYGTGTDVLTGIERLKFDDGVYFPTSAGNDTIVGTEFGDSIDGQQGDDILSGMGGADTLTGGAGKDVLDGGQGADKMKGGADDDIYVVDNTGDSVDEGNGAGGDAGGADLVKVNIATAGGTFTLGSYVENATLIGTLAYNLAGNALDNQLTGNAAANTLSGGQGGDTLSGGAGNDTLDGAEGNDTLDGGQGNDTMTGAAGDDTYVVDSLLDQVVELDGNGVDTVMSSVAFTLGSALENLILTGKIKANLIGNTSSNKLFGNAAANRLDGGTGADTLVGGAGGDTYVVDEAGDVVQETGLLATEIDTVEAGISYDLTSSANGNQLAAIEKLTLTGSANIDGTGNALANTITGNAGKNVLDGGAGDDKLIGGGGDDTYLVDAAGDKITEAVGGGTDAVLSSAATCMLAANVEKLTLVGTQAINGTGNTLANLIEGNSAANVIKGGAGDDTILGGGGADTIGGDAGNDRLVLADAGFTKVDGGAGQDVLAIDGFDLDLTLLADASIAGIETIEIIAKGGIAHTLKLGIEDVRAASATSNAALKASGFTGKLAGDSLVVLGSQGDTVVLAPAAGTFAGGDWQDAGAAMIEGQSFKVFNFYTGTLLQGTVAVEAGVQVQM